MTRADALALGTLDAGEIGLLPRAPGVLWRVYGTAHRPAGFDGSGRGSQRFSPISAAGAVVPTLYAASTLDGAFMEVVLRDVPTASAGHIVELEPATETRRVAQLRSTPLVLADLSAIGLRRLGLSRADVIERGPADYSTTQKRATWIYENCPTAQGLQWTSRQDDSAKSVVLFGPRVVPGVLEVVTDSEPFADVPHLDTLATLVQRLGACLRVMPPDRPAGAPPRTPSPCSRGRVARFSTHIERKLARSRTSSCPRNTAGAPFLVR